MPDHPQGASGVEPGQPTEPVTGDQPPQPDMGEPMTQPAGAPAAQPPAAPPAPAQPPAAPAPAVPAQPVPTPQFVAPTPAATGAAQPPAPGSPAPPAPAPATGTETTFPANTPWREMAPAEQVAYWQHQARKHEERVRAMGDYEELKTRAVAYEQLVTASQTEHERAVVEAKRQARTEALSEAGSQLVEQWVRAAAVGRISEEGVNALLKNLDRPRFLNQSGGVNTDMVFEFVGSLAPSAPAAPVVVPGAVVPGQPAPQPGQPAVPVAPMAAPARGTDFGQGQPGTANPSGLEAGREIARQRFAKPANA